MAETQIKLNNATTSTKRTATSIAIALAALAFMLIAITSGSVAWADTQSQVTSSSGQAVGLTAQSVKSGELTTSATSATSSQMNAAYKRCIAAIEAYDTKNYSKATYSTNSSGNTVISVKVGDLPLTNAQKQVVMDRVYYNTDYWYTDNCTAGKYTSTTLVFTCQYSDSVIPKMQKKMDAKTTAILKRVKNCTDDSEKAHLLHDWLIENVDYAAGTLHTKLAYSCIVDRKADCNGFAYGMDYLMRHAGLTTTAFAINDSETVDHIWNMVKIGSAWYHIDVTWDRYYTLGLYEGETFHGLLFLSDRDMNLDTHAGWKVYYKGADYTSKIKAKPAALNYKTDGDWHKTCMKKLAVGKTFKVGNLKYKVTTAGSKVTVSGVAKKTAKSYTIPETVWYRGYTYSVTGISASAFSTCTKATELTVKTTKLSVARTKKCLKGSKFTIVYVPSKKYTAYKKCFKKSNSGKSVTVKDKLAKGSTITKGSLTYKVSTVGSKVVVSGAAKLNATSYTIPKTVSYRGITYSVVGINSKAFAKCTKAKKLVVKTTKLNVSRTKNCLKGSKIKLVYVPKAKYTAYKKCFKKSNSGKAVTIKAK